MANKKKFKDRCSKTFYLEQEALNSIVAAMEWTEFCIWAVEQFKRRGHDVSNENGADLQSSKQGRSGSHHG